MLRKFFMEQRSIISSCKEPKKLSRCNLREREKFFFTDDKTMYRCDNNSFSSFAFKELVFQGCSSQDFSHLIKKKVTNSKLEWIYTNSLLEQLWPVN